MDLMEILTRKLRTLDEMATLATQGRKVVGVSSEFVPAPSLKVSVPYKDDKPYEPSASKHERWGPAGQKKPYTKRKARPTKEQFSEILWLFNNTKLSNVAIGKRYNLSNTSISDYRLYGFPESRRPDGPVKPSYRIPKNKLIVTETGIE